MGVWFCRDGLIGMEVRRVRMSTTRRDISVSALVPGSERLKEAHLYLLRKALTDGMFTE
jgi:hypothetical protein